MHGVLFRWRVGRHLHILIVTSHPQVNFPHETHHRGRSQESNEALCLARSGHTMGMPFPPGGLTRAHTLEQHSTRGRSPTDLC